MTEGQRLRAFVDRRWTREKGGIRGLATAVGTSPDTAYRWFNGKSPIDAYFLGRLAEKLGVRRWEIVQAMDGDEPDGADLTVRVEALERTLQVLTRSPQLSRGAEGSPGRPVPHEKAG